LIGIGLSLRSDDLIELRGVEIDRGLGCWRRRRRERRLALRQGGADGGRELHRIAVAAHVHVERRGSAAQDVIVDRRDLDPVLDQLRHHRVDLGLQQHEIAHDHRAAMRGLEGDPTAERERRADGDAIERHREVAARKSVAVHVTRDGGAAAERLVDLLPIDLLGAGSVGKGRQRARREHLNNTHDCLLLGS
jgi:hypothetical protein